MWLSASVSGWESKGSRFNTGQLSAAQHNKIQTQNNAWNLIWKCFICVLNVKWPHRKFHSLQLTGHVTRRGPIRAIQHCKWLHSSHSTLQAVIRPHQISMFQSLHSGIQDSNEYNKDPLTNESELFQSPSIKADQKSSKTSVSWELSRNSLWSRVLLPTPNTLSGIAQVWR